MKNFWSKAVAILLLGLASCPGNCPTSTSGEAVEAVASPAKPPILGFPGPIPGSAAQGTLISYGDGGFPQLLPPGDAGQSLASGGPGADNFWTYSVGSNVLGMPGVNSPPPTIAGGGWTLINNSPITLTAVDQSNNTILLTASNTAVAGNGMVRGGFTLGVEAGFDMVAPFLTATGGTLYLQAGPCMYASGSGEYLSLIVQSFYHSSAANVSFYLIGTHFSLSESFGNWPMWQRPYLRLQISGSNIVGQSSVDKVTWQQTFTVATATAFATAGTPNEVGICFPAPPATNGSLYLTLFDFTIN